MEHEYRNWTDSLNQGISDWYAPDTPAPITAGTERHPVCEAFFQLTGICPYTLNGRELNLRPGAFCFIRPWIPHQFGFQPGMRQPCEQMWFHFTPDSCSCGVVRANPDGTYLVPAHFSLPSAYFRVFEHLISIPDRGGAKLRHFFALILSEAAAAIESPASGPSRGDELANAVRAFIRGRNGANCSLGHLEKAFGYSRSHLSHVFRQCTGMTVGDCINQVRIDCMKEQQAHGMKQKEISAELGFSSPSAFWLWRERLRRKKRSPQGNRCGSKNDGFSAKEEEKTF